jgi:hypothetical protein
MANQSVNGGGGNVNTLKRDEHVKSEEVSIKSLPPDNQKQHRTVTTDTPVSKVQTSPTRCVGSSSLNQSLVDLSEIDAQSPLNPKKDFLNKSTSCLNRWSSADIGSSALSLARSATSLTVLNNMKFQSNTLLRSSVSLAGSTDSVASNSSTAEKSRAAKLAFLNSRSSGEQANRVDDKFSNHYHSLKKLSASRTSLLSLSEEPECRVNNPIGSSISSKAHVSSARANSRRSSSSSSKDSQDTTATKSSPIQGRFVSSIMNKLQKKGVNTSMTKISQNASSTN